MLLLLNRPGFGERFDLAEVFVFCGGGFGGH